MLYALTTHLSGAKAVAGSFCGVQQEQNTNAQSANLTTAVTENLRPKPIAAGACRGGSSPPEGIVYDEVRAYPAIAKFTLNPFFLELLEARGNR